MARPQNASRQTRAVLAYMLAEPAAWRHGYELSKATGLRSGTLYPLLKRLADQGLLTSGWRGPALPGRPPRHVYRLSEQGMDLAQAQAEGSAVK
jgi:PadR family transcriptional regulator PadR